MVYCAIGNHHDRIITMMHIEGPWLSTTGRKKGKQKFKNATAAQLDRTLKSSWNDIKKSHGEIAELKKRNRALSAEVWKPDPPQHRGAEMPKILSLDTGAIPCVKPPDKVYTGNAVIGIAVQHKSCLQPIFSQEAAEDSAKMRR